MRATDALHTLTERTYQGEADLTAIADLVNHCHQANQLDAYTSVAELREDFNEPTFDINRDLRLWQDDQDRLVAMANLWHPEPGERLSCGLGFFVHTDVRGSGVEAQIIHWAEARSQEIGQGFEGAVELHSGARSHLHDRFALLEQHGFSWCRTFKRLSRSLAEPVPAVSLPEGFTIRSVNSDQDGAAWVEMFNQTFVDHWNHHPMTVERFNYYSTLSIYDPGLDLVAIAPDGTMVAFCSSLINAAENAQLGRRQGWVGLLGTRRGYRRLGLGRAILLEGLRRLQTAEMETALIGVDSQNPNQAYQLYDDVGFQLLFESMVYEKVIREA